MIKCDKNKIQILGPSVVILAECSSVLEAVKNMLAEKHGEERAMKDMQVVWDTAFLSAEEIAAKNKEMEVELPPEVVAFADMLVKIFGGTPDNDGGVEEDKDNE